jgi:hypothetical protein
LQVDGKNKTRAIEKLRYKQVTLLYGVANRTVVPSRIRHHRSDLCV